MNEPKCYDCAEWCGRCLKDRINKIAWSEACSDFKPKYSVQYVIPEFVEVKA